MDGSVTSMKTMLSLAIKCRFNNKENTVKKPLASDAALGRSPPVQNKE